MSRTAQNMKKLIERKYYTTEEVARAYLDLFVMAKRITQDEYTDLILLVGEIYAPTEPPANPDLTLEVPTEGEV